MEVVIGQSQHQADVWAEIIRAPTHWGFPYSSWRLHCLWWCCVTFPPRHLSRACVWNGSVALQKEISAHTNTNDRRVLRGCISPSSQGMRAPHTTEAPQKCHSLGYWVFSQNTVLLGVMKCLYTYFLCSVITSSFDYKYLWNVKHDSLW